MGPKVTMETQDHQAPLDHKAEVSWCLAGKEGEAGSDKLVSLDLQDTWKTLDAMENAGYSRP